MVGNSGPALLHVCERDLNVVHLLVEAIIEV